MNTPGELGSKDRLSVHLEPSEVCVHTVRIYTLIQLSPTYAHTHTHTYTHAYTTRIRLSLFANKYTIHTHLYMSTHT